HVAAGEHTGPVGHERAVRDDGLALGLLHERVAVDPVEHRYLPDGRDDRVTVDDEVRSLDGDRTSATRGVRLAQRHALELDAAGATVLFDDAHRGAEELELDALVLGVVDLAVVRAHLLA